MRRKFALGLGLAGALSGSAPAQFAADRPPAAPVSPSAPPTLPPGVRPVGTAPPGGAYVAPVGGVAAPVRTAGFAGVAPADGPPAPPPPADVSIPSALGPNHEWAVKPEHGAFFICVKSYSRPSRPTPEDNGPSARALAEELAGEIRELYRVQAFLYEYVSEERKAEMAAVAAARERARVFAGQMEKHRQQAALQGMEFLEPDHRLRFKTVNYKDQIAVLVGGFKSDEDARKALDKVRTWPAPKNKNLMDGAAIVRPGRDGKPVLEEGHLNPYLTAHVVPNPAIARPDQPGEAAGLDPFVVKLNEGRPYSLLRATKGWTLAVKSFTAPVEIVSRDADGGGLMRKFGANKGADALKAGAEQAEKLAGALREMKAPPEKGGGPLSLEAFVLHTRTASLVTVGQFDGPNDPVLLQTKQLLSSFKPVVTEDKAGLRPVANAPTLFGNLMPIPIPRAAQ